MQHHFVILNLQVLGVSHSLILNNFGNKKVTTGIFCKLYNKYFVLMNAYDCYM